MKMIDFVMQNKDLIQRLFSEENDGEFYIAPEDFSFSCDGVKVAWEETALKFTLEIDPFKFVTTLMPEEMKENTADLIMISDAGLRRKIIELMEGDIKESVEQDKDMATDNLEEAKTALEESEKAMNSFLDALSEIKSRWGVP